MPIPASRPIHPMAREILDRLQREQVRQLYHFTAVENLPLICEIQALCSKGTLEKLGRWPIVSGGDDLSHSLDKYHGNWDKVSLNLTPFTPMVYRKKREHQLCFLVIQNDVAGWRDTIFTDTNATKTGHRRQEGLAGLDMVDFNVIRSITRPNDPNWKHCVQAEVLVTDRIPLELVTKIVFASRASETYAEHLCNYLPHPEFVVDHRVFTDSAIATTIEYPHIMDLKLTSTIVDENTVGKNYGYQETFYRGFDLQVTCIATVTATPGTKSSFLWQPIGRNVTNAFARAGQYYIWSSVSLDDLPDGICSMEYRHGNGWLISRLFAVI